MSYFYFLSISNNIEDAIRNDIRQHSKNEAFHLGELLKKQIQFVASSVDIAVGSPSIQSGKFELGSEVINLAQERTPTLTDRYFWLDANGKTIWSSAFMNDPEQYKQYKGFDVSGRPYFSEVLHTQKPYYSPVIKSLDNAERMFISYPIFVDGTFQGVVVASVKADTLSNAITKQLAPGFDSSLGLVDSQGGVVYSQVPDIIGENVFGEKVQSLLAPAFDKQEKLVEFNDFLKESINPSSPTVIDSRDFTATGGQAITVAAAPISIVESELQANSPQHQILTLYITTPHDIAAKIGPLVDAQRNYSIAVIAAISATALVASYFILSSNKRLERTVDKRTTDLKEANKRLEEHDKLQSEFINVAAHELRTPVQPLLGAAEMLEDQMLDGQQEVKVSKPEVEMIVRNAKRLAKLTYDILEVSRIESKSLKLEKEQINLQEKIMKVIEDVKLFIDQSKHLQIIFEPKVSEPVIVEADRTKLFEVLSNLLRNSIKFTSNGEIRIILEKTDDEAVVIIQDTGKGIDPEILPKMFDRFTSKSDSGTGLGLFIAKSIVEAHGGTISGENNPDGIGARFRFTLPLCIVKSDTEKEPVNH